MIKYFTITRILIIILILFCFQSCVKDYANPLFISEKAKTYLPYQPGEELVFRNTIGDSLTFIANSAITSIITNTDDFRNKLYTGSHYYYETLELKAFQNIKGRIQKDCFTTKLYSLGDSKSHVQQFCEINLSYKKSNYRITFLAGNYSDFNTPWWFVSEKKDS